MSTVRNIVIIGGGFAGTAFARHIARRLPPDHRLVMVSEESYTTFNPLLAEAVGASIFPEQLVAPLREVLQIRDHRVATRFVMGRVTGIDPAARTISCTSLQGRTDLEYAHLVLAFGNRARLDLIPGMAEHALALKTVGDALHIRNMVLRRLARMELETDPAVRRHLGHFAVIGGGFSGIEVAGELIDCLHSILPFYRGVDREELCVSVVQNIDRLLPELPQALGRKALASLRERGVAVYLNVSAVEVTAQGLRLADGNFLTAATVISTIGTRPNPLAAALAETGKVSLERGRLVAQGDLRLAGLPDIWGIGDCALIPNAIDAQPAPPTAQFAIQEGKLAARNVLAVLAGGTTQALKYRSRGMMAAMGHRRGVAQVAGINVSGLAAWLLWRAYYLSQMPTPGRKLRIFVEWTWGMFFRADITHLRFTRSGSPELVEKDSGPSR